MKKEFDARQISLWVCKVFGKICPENLSERSPNRDLSGIGQKHVNWPPTMNMSVNAKNFTHPQSIGCVNIL